MVIFIPFLLLILHCQYVSAKSGKILLAINGHEGSHAICESFQAYCVPVNCEEEYDYYRRYNNGRTSMNWVNGTEKLIKIRLFLEDLEQIPKGTTLLFLARSDLMRWTLSLYDKMTDYGPHDPQFHSENISVGKHFFEMDEVHRIAEELQTRWKSKIDLMEAASAHGLKHYTILYELFLEDPEGYIADIAAKLQIDTGQRCNYTSTVHKVHREEIGKSVTNHLEFRRFFETANIPPFQSLMHAAGMHKTFI